MADTLLLSASSGENFFRFLVALFVFVVVLIATYYVSRWMAGYQKARLSASNFEVIDSMRISSNKYMMIIRIGRGRYYSVGVGKDEMVVIGELSEDEIVFANPKSHAKSMRESASFASFMAAIGHSSEKSEQHED